MKRLKLPVIILLLFLSGCTIHHKKKQEPERWTSSDPLAIPLRARAQKYKQGNLVLNPSFESGKVLFSDSLKSTDNIDGWSIVGESVTWLHEGMVAVPYDLSQVNSGKGSVRIHRSGADETEVFGQGVLSDYIKVIPGNYQLSLKINLRNIENPKSRLGVRLYDAIDIKIIYYDKNRIEIDPDMEAPYSQNMLSNSFKGTSFSNFVSIDSSGWLHIIGKSHQFPFPDGDLQDNTRFVRIFIGLKGNGTMWVDDVSYRYTRWNFTTLERIKPYFDSTLVKSKLIIPQPRKVEILESLIYYRPYYKNVFPVILISPQADPLTRQAALLLENRIKHLLLIQTELNESQIPSLLKTKISDSDLEKAMIFSLGKTSLAQQYMKELPGQSSITSSKAYFIHSVPEQNNIIFLYGNEAKGNYFAAQVASQLFDEKKLIFHNANVIDYPSNNEYAILLLNYSELTEEFIATAHQTRFYEIYLPGLEGKTREMLKAAGKLKNLSTWIYYPWSWENSNSQSYHRIQSDLKHLKSNNQNLKGIALLNEDLFSELSLGNILSKKNNLISAGALANETKIKILMAEAKRRNLQIEIMPELDNNNKLINALNEPFSMEEIIEIDGVPVIWTANQFQTWRIDEADLALYSMFYKNPKILLDLTLYPRSEKLSYFANDSVWPYKLQTACIFEPFSNEILPGIYKQVEKTIIGFELVSVFDRIRLQTASDYFWNPSGYNPDLSLYRALVSEYGELLAQDLIYFNDYYFKLKMEFILAKQLKNTNKHQRKIVSYLKELDLVKNRILREAENINNHELSGAINILHENLKGGIHNAFPVLASN